MKISTKITLFKWTCYGFIIVGAALLSSVHWKVLAGVTLMCWGFGLLFVCPSERAFDED